MPSLTFYPLGNADCCRIHLVNDDQILFDFGAMGDPNDPKDKRFDLAAEVRKDMKKVKRDAFAAVAFTHLDNDHVKGAQDIFFLEHAKCYQEGERFKINELWVPAAAILEDGLEDDARIIRSEARYRLKNGERIRVFSRPDALKDWLKSEGISYDSRKHLFVDAGQLVPTFTLDADGLEFFVHSPFASRLNECDVIDRNTDSIVVQVTFNVQGKLTRVILASDVNHEALAEIHELDLRFAEMRPQACRMHHKFSIALMSRAFADHDTSGPETKEGSCRRSDKSCVRVYGSRQIFHQIWFEKNRPAQHIYPEQSQSVQN